MTFALQGIRVLDFGIFLAGPFTDRILADLGADVIKVEDITGDPGRGLSVSGTCVNKGKRSLAVNLKTPEGLEIIRRLVPSVDVVHHNMRLGVAERLGIGYEQLRPLNPRLIYCHSSGYGAAGPRAYHPTFEPLHSAISGMLTLTAGEGNEPMTYLTHLDFGVGLNGALAILMALIERTQSGEGQFLETPQTAAGMLCGSDVFFHDGVPSDFLRLDARQTGHGPLNRLYETAEGWICIACNSQAEWERLCAALKRPDLRVDDRFRTAAGRRGCGDALSAILEEAFQVDTAAAWFERLDAAGVPCELPGAFRGNDFLRSPRNLASGLVAQYDRSTLGPMTEIGVTVRLSETPGVNQGPAPALGEHTQEILREMGYDEAQIAAWERKGVIATRY